MIAEARPQFFVSQKRNEISELRGLFRNLPAETAARPEATEKRREMLKRLITYMSMGIDVSSLFPEVVLASATSDFVQKRMVSIYLNNYAQANPKTAILVINAYQKDLMNADPRIRGLALKALSSLGVDSVAEYAREAVRQGLNDTSNYTRTFAVIGVDKLLLADPGAATDLVEQLEDIVTSVGDSEREPPEMQVLVTAIQVLLNCKGGDLQVSKLVIVYLFNMLVHAARFHKTVILHILKSYQPESDDELVGLLETIELNLSSASPSVVISAVICMLSLIRRHYEATGRNNWMVSPLAVSVIRRVTPTLITLSNHYSILNFIRELCTAEQKYASVISEHWVWLVPKYADIDSFKILKYQILSHFSDPMILESVSAIQLVHCESSKVLAALVDLFRSITFQKCAHHESTAAAVRSSDLLDEVEETVPEIDECEIILQRLLEWYRMEIPSVCNILLPLLADLWLTHPYLQVHCEQTFKYVMSYLDKLEPTALDALLRICGIKPLNLPVCKITNFLIDKISQSNSSCTGAKMLVPILQCLSRVFRVFPSAAKPVLLRTLNYINERVNELPVEVVERYLLTARLLGRERQIFSQEYLTQPTDWRPTDFVNKPAPTSLDEFDIIQYPYPVLPFAPVYEVSAAKPATATTFSPPIEERKNSAQQLLLL